MRKIGVSSDSTCDLTLEIIQKENITIVPLHVLLKANEYKNGIDITPDEIFEFVKELLKKNFKFKEIIPTVAGSVITSHCGKNTLGVLFLK